MGFGLPDDYEDTTNSYWRLMVAFPMLIAIIHLLILTFILKEDTPTYIFLNYKKNPEEKASL